MTVRELLQELSRFDINAVVKLEGGMTERDGIPFAELIIERNGIEHTVMRMELGR